MVSQTSIDRVLFNVGDVASVIAKIAQPMFMKSSLPNREFRLQSKRISTLNALHTSFDRLLRWRNYDMNVIGHDNKSMQCVTPLITIAKQDINHQLRMYF